MAHPAWLNKYLTMKPEVSKIYDDLEAWLDHCRFNLIEFNPSDMYRTDAYKEWSRRKNFKPRQHYNNRNDYNRSGGGYNKKFQRQ
jgi:hypothetical protein